MMRAARATQDEATRALREEAVGLDVSETRTRRLSDKILGAFTHAYATGEFEVAKQLHRALKLNQTRCSAKAKAGIDARAGYDPVGQAELWIAFVAARDRYKELSAGRKGAPRETLDALDAMKEAYRLWSFS